MPRIQRLPGGQLVVTIPKAIARFKGWKKGDEVIFKEDRDTRGGHAHQQGRDRVGGKSESS